MATQAFLRVAEWVTPVLTSSHFYDQGVLTPEEFVKAGDELVAKCGTWKWAAGSSSYNKKYLPKDKQYLVARKIPSQRRANSYGLQDAKEAVVDTDVDLDSEGWLETHVGADLKKSKVADVEEIDMDGLEIVEDDKKSTLTQQTTSSSKSPQETSKPDEDVPEIGEIGDGGDLLEAQEADVGTLLESDSGSNSSSSSSSGRSGGKMLKTEEPEENIIKTRTYDISITYDKYYRTPRVFLFGYNEHREPLTPEEVMEDISSEHANKTVTVEPHPNTGVSQASIHPCKHGPVMKKMLDQLALVVKGKEAKKASESTESKKKSSTPATAPTQEEIYGITVYQYLFLFLKFISTVIPTIEYDYTASV